MTFAHDITPTPAPGTHAILLAAWASLIVSLVSIVASFLSSQRVIREAMAAFEEKRDPNEGLAKRLTEGLNIAAGGLLVVGLALLGWYALANS